MSSRKHIAHLIVRLDTGGAEKSLLRLVRGTQNELAHHVICFGPPTPLGEDIASLGVKVSWLDYRKQGPLVLWQAWRLLRAQPVDVLQGWMYFGNLIASLLALVLPRQIKVAWNIRSSPVDFRQEKKRMRLAIELARPAFFRPHLVIYNSYAGQQAHARFGYNVGPNVVIHNGIDVDEFAPSADARAHWRDEWAVGEQCWVGLVCRFHLLKGVDDYLQAIQQLRKEGAAEQLKKARFLLAGPGMTATNPQLVALLEKNGLTAADVDLLGAIDDPTKFLPALDLLVIASLREGTPNILLEAMACGVKTVSTRVGDVERILQDPARLVSPGDATELAHKITQALSTESSEHRLVRIEAERDFVHQHYATGQCMAAYLEHYGQLMVETTPP